MGPEYIALAASLVGTAASMSAQHQQEKQQRTILNRQLERDEKATDKSTQMVLDEGQRYSMQNRQDGLQQNEQKAFDQAQADINGAGGASIGTAADNSNVSDDFLKTKAARTVDEGNRLTSIAREAAKSRAPGMLGLDDSLSLASMSGGQRNLWGTTKNMSGAAGMEAQSVGQPAYGALGKIATAAGGAMAANGYGQQASGSPPNPYYRNGINWGAR
jgi:hypothetical protein